MEVVKRERIKKLEVGDCVSVPHDYFGASFASVIRQDVTRIVGRVLQIEGNNNVSAHLSSPPSATHLSPLTLTLTP